VSYQVAKSVKIILKMRKIITSLILIISLITFGQETKEQKRLAKYFNLEDGRVVYTGVVEANGASKDSLYFKAKNWFVESYNSSNDVIQLDDENRGQITGKGLFTINHLVGIAYIHHMIKIEVKESKYKYTISNFKYINQPNTQSFQIEEYPKSAMGIGREEMYKNIDSEIRKIIESLEKYMKKSPKKDW
jgi:hypothetical protein